MKTILITGGTGGIGKQTAIALAKLGNTVVVTGRNKASGEAAVAEIRAASGNEHIGLLPGDITTKDGILSLVAQFLSDYPRLDVLINNAGLAQNTRTLTADGLEANFAANVVAPYALTLLLMDVLRAAEAPRVITLMGGDLPANLLLDNLQAEKSFDGLNSYSQSKMAMLCLMYELSQRLGPAPTVNMCYPGQASTNMTRSVTMDMLPWQMRLAYPLFKLFTRPDGGKSAQKASRSSVLLATDPNLRGETGLYYTAKCVRQPMPAAAALPENRAFVWQYVNEAIHQTWKINLISNLNLK